MNKIFIKASHIRIDEDFFIPLPDNERYLAPPNNNVEFRIKWEYTDWSGKRRWGHRLIYRDLTKGRWIRKNETIN